jgi:hypothetical protein
MEEEESRHLPPWWCAGAKSAAVWTNKRPGRAVRSVRHGIQIDDLSRAPRRSAYVPEWKVGAASFERSRPSAEPAQAGGIAKARGLCEDGCATG